MCALGCVDTYNINTEDLVSNYGDAEIERSDWREV